MGSYRRRRHGRRGGKSRRRTARNKGVRGYTLRGAGGRINYVGITNNPRRRASQHRRAGKRGRMRVETGSLSRKAARRWEGTRLKKYRKRSGGRNPRYNKTKSGGWKRRSWSGW